MIEQEVVVLEQKGRFFADICFWGDAVAIWVERWTRDRGVAGSTLARALLAQQP